MVDNFDSFTYNLVHLMYETGCREITVRRNNQIALQEVNSFDKILISPGPGIPDEAGMTLDIIREYAPSRSILGVCLGHQAIAEAFGGKLKNLETPLHGVKSTMKILKDDYLFKSCPQNFRVGHYHSWVVSDVPDDLEVTAENEAGLIMGIRHRRFDVRGIQFHPESILTEHGFQIIHNWIKGGR